MAAGSLLRPTQGPRPVDDHLGRAVEPEAVEEFGEGHLVKITRALVEELAAEGRCVVVGRASAAVLARSADTLHVRLVAPFETRVKAATQRLSLNPTEAPRIVAERDANRARYHREYYDRDCNDPIHYHMVLNTGRLGMEGAAQVILDQFITSGEAK